MGKFVKEDGDRMDITTPICRTSWLFIHKEDPKQNEKKPDPFKHKVTFMLPKNEKALESLGLNPKQVKGILDEVKVFKKELEDEAKKVAEARFKAKWKSTRWNPLLDGDKDKNGNEGPLSGWEGNSNFWILRTKSKFLPTVIDKDKKAIETDDYPEGLYSGCWVRGKISLYPYDVDGNKGVAAGLGFFIKKIANDEQFKGGGGTESAGKAFEDSDLDDIDDSDFDKEFENEEVEDDDEDDLK
jgi:hypothetical protein